MQSMASFSVHSTLHTPALERGVKRQWSEIFKSFEILIISPIIAIIIADCDD